MATTPRKKHTLAATLLRVTCPVVVYGWLLWVAIANKNTNLLLCLIALLVTIGYCIYLIRPYTQACNDLSRSQKRRDETFKAAMQMTKRFGGIFCTLAVVVGVSYFYIPERFMVIALPVILSGWAAMFFAERKARVTL